MLTTDAFALVVGAAVPDMHKMKKIQVIRSFLHKQRSAQVGEVIELPQGAAMGLIQMGKAVEVKEDQDSTIAVADDVTEANDTEEPAPKRRGRPPKPKE